MYRLFHQLNIAALLLLIATSLGGCGVIYKTTGDVLISYGKAEMVPHLLSYRDVGMACATGEALTPLLMSFAEVGSNPDKLAPLVFVSAASCAESRSLEAELRYLSALKRGEVNVAQDARIVQKTQAELAARRLYTAYQRTVKIYGEPSETSCPRFRNDYDELVWMVGLIAGVQSLLNDSVAETAVGVPRDVAAKVERGARCLDNRKWWGVPQGMRAALWNILPMLAPEGANPWQELDQATQIGFDQGVRLASALYVISAYSTDDQPRLRRGIRDFARYQGELDPSYALLDAIAGELIAGISHRMWVEATGQRTPFQGLGDFWDDPAASSEALDIDDLL